MGHKVRIFLPDTFRLGQEIEADKELVSRLGQVMRLRDGAEVLVFNGVQGLWRSGLRVRGRKLYFYLDQAVGAQPIKLRTVTLYVPLIKGQRLSHLIRGAVELGVERLVPYKSAYGGAYHTWQKDRIEAIVISALEQSERLYLPQIDAPVPFEEAIAQKSSSYPFFAFLERNLSRDHHFLKKLHELGVHSHAGIMIGPEGGFSPTEAEFLKQNESIHAVNLGGYILRSETAAHTALSLWHGYMDSR